MNIVGQNTLACTKSMSEDVPDGEPLRVQPLPHQPVVEDLVPVLRIFMRSLRKSSRGYKPFHRRPRRNGAKAMRIVPSLMASTSVSSACCSTLCPSY